ncbi:MAG: hypothetical protein M5U09_30520 [Gammaproteobacteria bacterium]|nr:hypothetical protein [Gammaproteobacteria bacterium]
MRGTASRKVHNNYELLSFNFGPTLLAWMEREAPDVYADVRRSDGLSQERRAGTATPWRRCTATSSCRWPPAATR